MFEYQVVAASNVTKPCFVMFLYKAMFEKQRHMLRFEKVMKDSSLASGKLIFLGNRPGGHSRQLASRVSTSRRTLLRESHSDIRIQGHSDEIAPLQLSAADCEYVDVVIYALWRQFFQKPTVSRQPEWNFQRELQ